MKKRKFIALITILAMMAAYLPGTPLSLVGAAFADDTSTMAAPNLTIITDVAEYGQEVVAVAIALGGSETIGSSDLASIAGASGPITVKAKTVDNYETAPVTKYDGIRTIKAAYLNDTPDLLAQSAQTKTDGEYLILELAHGFDLTANPSGEQATTLAYVNGRNRPLELNYSAEVTGDVPGSTILKSGTKFDVTDTKDLTLDKFDKAGILDFGTGSGYKPLHYSYYKPQGTAPTDGYPLVLWLHGGGEGSLTVDDDFTNAQLLANMGATGWVVNADAQEPFFVVAPQANFSWDWAQDSAGKDDYRLNKLVQDIVNNPSNEINKDKIYISGCSNGGAMTLSELIYSEKSPDPATIKFAAAIIDCPATSYMGAGQRPLTEADLEAIKDVPMWFYQGGNDTTVRPANTDNTIAGLKKQDVNEVIYTKPAKTEGALSNQTEYNGHWIWMRPLNNLEESSGDTKLVGGLLTGQLPLKPMGWLLDHTNKTHTVTFDPGEDASQNEGTLENAPAAGNTQTVNVRDGGHVSAPKATLASNLLKEWQDENSNPVDFSDLKIKNDATFTAQWESDTPTSGKVWVSFETNGGGFVAPEEIDDNDGELSADPSLNVAKPGYTLEGWYRDSAFTPSSKWEFGTTKTSNEQANFILYAKWLRDVTLIFRKALDDQGTVTGLPQVIAASEGDQIDSSWQSSNLTSYAKAGFEFDKWLIGGTDAVSGATELDSSNDTIDGTAPFAYFDAAWTPFTAELELDGGTITPAVPNNKIEVNPKNDPQNKIVQGTLKEPTEPVGPNGKIFVKWVDDTNGGANAADTAFDFDTVLTGNIKLKAIYGVTVTFKLNDDSTDPAAWDGGATGDKTAVAAQGQAIDSADIPAEPTRPHYTFDGWSKDKSKADGGASVADIATETFSADTTLFANWEGVEYKITLDPNGGNWSGDSQPKEIAVTYPEKVDYDAHIKPYVEGAGMPTRLKPGSSTEEYTLIGWYDKNSTVEGNQLPATDHEVPANITYFARWNLPTVTVTLNANGGTFAGGATTKDLVAVEGGTLQETAPDPDPTPLVDKEFDGWYEDKASADALDGTKKIADIAVETFSATTEVWAGWKDAATVTLTFDANGGAWAGGATKSLPPITKGGKALGADISALLTPAPTRNGYDLDGWYDAQSGGTKIDVTADIDPVDASKTYYAQWKKRSGSGFIDTSNSGGGSSEPEKPATPPAVTTTSGGVTGGGAEGGAVEGSMAKFGDASTVSGWALPFLERLVKEGVISGYEDNTLRPKGNVTRAEFTKMIVTALKITAGGAPKSFPADVKAGDWYKEYVDAASSNGLINGITETSFAPGAQISRQDLATIAYRALLLAKVTIAAPDGGKFPDDGQIADYAKDAVYALKRLGIIGGRDSGAFDPTAFATREETAKIICGIIDEAAAQAATPDATQPGDAEPSETGSAPTGGATK